MKHRQIIKNLLSGAAAVSAGGILPGLTACGCSNNRVISANIPGEIAGMSLQELRNDYRERILQQYLLPG